MAGVPDFRILQRLVARLYCIDEVLLVGLERQMNLIIFDSRAHDRGRLSHERFFGLCIDLATRCQCERRADFSPQGRKLPTFPDRSGEGLLPRHIFAGFKRLD